MAYFAVRELVLHPGRAEAFDGAVRRLVEAWAVAPGSYSHRVYLGRDDASLVLAVSRWRSQADFSAALERVAPALLDAVDACIDEVAAEQAWYQPIRENEMLSRRASVATATRIGVAEADVAAFLERDARVQEAVRTLAGVVAVRLLAALHAPGEFMLLNEYADEATHAAAAAGALQVATPVPFRTFRRFRGAVGWQWERSALEILGR